jgi:DNA-binding GntR family transcriptional regulator
MTAAPEKTRAREEACQQVMGALHGAITTGAIPPGAHLDCAQIARRHQTSASQPR